MRAQTSCVVILVFCLFACLSLIGFAEDKTSPEAYSGVAVGTGGGVGGKTIQFDFRIAQYTTDAPLTIRSVFSKVTFNAKGEGTGQIMAAAKIRFDKKKGKYEIESYGNQYLKATNVRPWK
jgi:hypothetical protein